MMGFVVLWDFHWADVYAWSRLERVADGFHAGGEVWEWVADHIQDRSRGLRYLTGRIEAILEEPCG